MMPNQNKQLNTLVSAGITAGWLIVSFIVMGRHEIWLDEAQQWLVVKESNSMDQMFRNMRYEGHAPMWYLLLFAVSRITDSYEGMQILHLFFAGASVFVVVRYSPFPLWVKLILPFTYFFGYEYAIISRNYAPAVLFILLACLHIRDDNKRLFVVPLLLGIATLFHSYAGLVALAMLFYWYRLKRKQDIETHNFILPVLPFVGAVLIVVYFSRIPADHFWLTLSPPKYFPDRFGTILLLPFTSLMHFPELKGDYWWNTNLFLPDSQVIKAVIGILFWSLPALVFRRNKPALYLYLLGIVILSLGVFFTPNSPAVRHAGFVAVLFLVCAWMGGKSVYETKFPKIFLTVVLIVQVGSYCATVYREYARPFSNAKNVADFVRDRYPEMKIAAYPLFVSPPVCTYLGKDIFYPGAEGNFASWKKSAIEIRPDEFMHECKDYMKAEGLDSMVVIGHIGYSVFELTSPELKEQATFRGAAVGAEDYVVYILTRE